jgi:hypothetical protein
MRVWRLDINGNRPRWNHSSLCSRRRSSSLLLRLRRTYVTGGLKTVGATVKALDTVDGIGLARPVCQGPHLRKDILEGKVMGSIHLKLDDNNFGLTNMAAGTQIRQIGKDQEPIDLSDQKNVDAFMKDM